MVDLKKNLGHMRYRGGLCGNLVPALWEYMSALSVGIRSQALTDEDL